MTDDIRGQLLTATAELWVHQHRDRLGIRAGAAADVARRLLAVGVLARGDDGSLRSQAGGSPDDLIATIRADAGHLFGGPDNPAPAVAPKPDPRGLSPSAKLALANGDDVKARL